MAAHPCYCLYQPGECFLPEVRRLISTHGGGLVDLIQADLSSYEWHGGPIKILLVDAMKNQGLTRQIARTFYPHLTTGGLLIHQDFKHYFTSWIHVLQYRLRDYFRFQGSVPNGGTVAFEVLATIPRYVVEQAADFVEISHSEVEECFRYSLGLVGETERANIAAAHVMYYAHLGQNERAHELIEEYRRRGLSGDGQFPLAVAFVEQSAKVIPQVFPEHSSLVEKKWSSHSLSSEVLATLNLPPTIRERAKQMLKPLCGSAEADVLKIQTMPLKLKKGAEYLIEVEIRADSPRSVSCAVVQNHPPFDHLAPEEVVELTTEWQTFQKRFTANQDEPMAQVAISTGGSGASVEIRKTVVREDGKEEIDTRQALLLQSAGKAPKSSGDGPKGGSDR